MALASPFGTVTALSASPDGAVIAALAADRGDPRDFVLVDARTGAVRAWLEKRGHVVSTAFSTDGRRLAARTWDSKDVINVRDLGTGSSVGIARPRELGSIDVGVAWRPDARGVLLVTRSYVMTSDGWTGSLLAVHRLFPKNPVLSHASAVTGAWLASGDLAVAMLGQQGEASIGLLDAASGVVRRVLAAGTTRTFGRGSGPSMKSTTSRDGALFALGRDDGTVELWDVLGSRRVSVARPYPEIPGPVEMTVVSLSNDARAMSVTTRHGPPLAEGTVKVFDVATGDPVAEIASTTRPAPLFAVMIDARSLAVGDDAGALSVFDLV